MAALNIGTLPLTLGGTLEEVHVAYVAHGRLNAKGDNAVLVTHGYTSSHSMLSPTHHTAEGSWAPMLGPGRVLDTERLFIVCSNMLGSSFGSTGPNTTNPTTGRPWGPEFPRINLADIVAAQHRLLVALGVKQLHAVVGPSYGGFQALQWALDHPDMVRAIGSIVSGLYSPPGLNAATALAKFSDHPAWHGGWHYGHNEQGGLRERLFEQRQQTLRHYGLMRLYEDRYPDPPERQQRFDAACRFWADHFDPHSMAVLADAAAGFDARPHLHRITARTLLVVSSTDAIFPPSEETRAQMTAMTVPNRYAVLDSPYGHMAAGVELHKLESELRWLLN